MKKMLFPALMLCSALLYAGEIVPLEAKTVTDGGWSRTIKPSEIFCSIPLGFDKKVSPDTVLVFEYRVTSPVPCYVAANLRDANKRMTFSQFPVSREWRQAVLPFAGLRYADKGREKLPDGTALKSIVIYAKNLGAKDAAGEIRLDLRKVRFETRSPQKVTTATPSPFKQLPYTATEKNWTNNPAELEASCKDGVFSLKRKQFNAFTTLELILDMPYLPQTVCDFEYRVIPNGAKIIYVAVNFIKTGKGSTFHQFPVKEEWTRGTIHFSKLGKTFAKGDTVRRVTIYIKSESGTPALEVRNVRFTADPNYDPLAGIRVSYSAYPLFDWPAEKGAAGYRITINGKNFETVDPFFVPASPMKPGMVEYSVTALPSGKNLKKKSC